MNRLFSPLLLLFMLSCSCVLSAQMNNSLESNFIHPENFVKTGVYWYWISGNISEEGVVKDLYAMKEAGIDRAQIGDIGIDTSGKVRFGSEEWWNILHAALKTATKLGIEIGIFNSPGWSQSGGPWVKPEQAMRYLSSVKTEIKGGKEVTIILPKPDKDFQDVKVIAFPTVNSHAMRMTNANTTIKSIPILKNLSALIDGNCTDQGIVFDKRTKFATIDYHTDQPFLLRSLKLYVDHKAINAKARLLVKKGGAYFTLAEFDVDRFNSELNVGFKPYAPIVISVPATKSSDFRLELSNLSESSGIIESVFSSIPLVERYPEKTLAKMFQTPQPMWTDYQWKPQPVVDDLSLLINPTKVVDISSCLFGDRLNWKVPAGDWTVLRLGMIPTGTKNSPASPEATGLETDKMSRKHIEEHFNAFMGEILRRIPAEDRKCWKYVVEDSYEMGGQNFTDDFLQAFENRYGYDPLPYLPVYEGYVVNNEEVSDRFLWDLRRLVADKVAYDYVGGLRDISHKYGLSTWLENYGHWGFPGEFLMYGGQSDEIAGEFWSFGTLGDIENRVASSCGHIYGKDKIWAESFTSGGAPFNCYPAMMKKRGDRFFSEGINNTLLHLYISQPYEDKEPGVNAWFNSEFNRKNTWFSQLDLFITYLKRVNYMLQQGKNVADVAYFIGEDAPKMTGIADPALPKGYQFDFINAEVIERDMFVDDGLLTLPHGTQYRILVLPQLTTMRPELLVKIKKLIEEGAIVMGPAPQRSPSLQNYPAADTKVKTMTDEMWKGLDGVNVKTKKMGRGTLINGMNMAEALQYIDCSPDCRIADNAPLLYGHRKDGAADIYFVSNQKDSLIEVYPEFRVNGKQPELWNAVTGTMRDLSAYGQTASGTVVPMKLYPYESAFIVFRKESKTKGKSDLLANYPLPKTIIPLNNGWKAMFDVNRRGPAGPVEFAVLEDITQNKNFDIRHYSGTILYSKDFTLNQIPKGSSVILDLNDVGVMAKVKVNGQYAGGVWTAPYRLDISSLVKKGENTLAVEVVTTWQNRLIGDSGLPENERKTWTMCNNYKPTDTLQKSGLVGPVSIQIIDN